ncbi:YedE family putative selenium transporter [Clostridium polynesiense]|uniref:YedE family putative selenium transporter n=1 Tax=Clostridium polynesiense TaxID=1325933 RepID=UPI00059030E9|nr:YedE family putative selenium transporter [Clostridium polynesiense]
MKEKRGIILGGALIGILSVAAVYFGNPKNMGICIACFIRDTAGALSLHGADTLQYVRPEILGMVLGAFIIAYFKKEFSSKGGSSPFLRFLIGFAVMIGALMFLGCPTRMVLRLAGGDFNALFGIAGFTVGIVIGIFFLNKGFTLKRNYKQTQFEGFLFPIINVILLALVASGSVLLLFSAKGPGSMHAPVLISLALGAAAGIVCQRTRLCMAGGIRDLLLFKDSYLMWGFISITVAAFLGNLVLGFFSPGFANQPVAHTDGLWNFLGMTVVGWGSILLGGCPMRQLILSGEGNVDSVVTIMGMLLGAAFAHNFKLASSPAGPTPNGQIAVLLCLVFLAAVSFLSRDSKLSMKMKGEVSVG